jgi:hypothetical protein
MLKQVTKFYQYQLGKRRCRTLAILFSRMSRIRRQCSRAPTHSVQFAETYKTQDKNAFQQNKTANN